MSSMMLSIETPKHNPSKLPQTAKKSLNVYISFRFTISTNPPMKRMCNCENCKLERAHTKKHYISIFLRSIDYVSYGSPKSALNGLKSMRSNLFR